MGGRVDGVGMQRTRRVGGGGRKRRVKNRRRGRGWFLCAASRRGKACTSEVRERKMAALGRSSGRGGAICIAGMGAMLVGGEGVGSRRETNVRMSAKDTLRLGYRIAKRMCRRWLARQGGGERGWAEKGKPCKGDDDDASRATTQIRRRWAETGRVCGAFLGWCR